jgi:hypothetical protein
MWSYRIGNQDLKQSENEKLSPVKMRTSKYGKMELVLAEWFQQNRFRISACACEVCYIVLKTPTIPEKDNLKCGLIVKMNH